MTLLYSFSNAEIENDMGRSDLERGDHERGDGSDRDDNRLSKQIGSKHQHLIVVARLVGKHDHWRRRARQILGG
jgi:hypothetical protein